ncbi:hypothetical protein C8A03DRAFT_39670 [Achaetomium macrosporum]|uniref:Uncharacterized protein n=1 Tax=Achaetomium macrosporum TaxID=79813 RepID=A0AAN7BZZ8_9PEZI|nr:hypothetical protein C8A03DRAFT_39670 [Achaetomium macrosporum]
MADRVKKRKRTSTARRHDQVRFLERFGSIMPSCSFCYENKSECVASDRYDRCLPCVKAGRPHCDVHGVDLRPFIKEKERLDAERQATLKELFANQSKLARLEQQSRALEAKALAAFRRESRLLEEEEAAERAAASSGAPGAGASSAPPTTLSPFDPSLLDSAGGSFG